MSLRDALKTERILVVDDDEVTRAVICGLLRDQGYLVEEAGDGPSALAAFVARRPALVVLDILMPGMDGFEACRRMRRLPDGETTPVLTLTGLDDVESVNQAFDAGATDFSSKTGAWALLTHRVRFLLRSAAAVRALAASEAELSEAQRIGRIGNWELDAATGLLRGSIVAMEVFGAAAPDEPTTLEDLLSRLAPGEPERLREAIGNTESGDGRFSLELLFGAPGPEQRCLLAISAGRAEGGDGPPVLRGTVQDITERWNAARRIHRLAYYDDVTELPNRVLFMDSLGRALTTSRRAAKRLGVLLIDLDDFKRVNDTYGHDVGDELLRVVGTRLRESIRATDGLGRDPTFADLVGRLGGDEFIMFLNDLKDDLDPARVAKRLMESLARPITIRDHEMFARASVGISVFPSDGDDAATLLRHADTALYHAKGLGKDCFSFFEASMNEAMRRRLALESELRRAVSNGEFELHLQPQCLGATGSVFGAEALVRWRHPKDGMVAPGQFIAVAEETGLIVEIGRWVLERALRAQLAAAELGARDLRIGVNISAAQFRRGDVLGDLQRLAAEMGAIPRLVELELTESTLLEQGSAAQRLLEKARDLGFRIAIDDFGTGYSSLGYLRMLPIDTLKLDRIFLSDLVEIQRTRSIVGAIVALADALGVELIAEGVETEGQREVLLSLGVQRMQGYLFGRPEPVEAFLESAGARTIHAGHRGFHST